MKISKTAFVAWLGLCSTKGVFAQGDPSTSKVAPYQKKEITQEALDEALAAQKIGFAPKWSEGSISGSPETSLVYKDEGTGQYWTRVFAGSTGGYAAATGLCAALPACEAPPSPKKWSLPIGSDYAKLKESKELFARIYKARAQIRLWCQDPTNIDKQNSVFSIENQKLETANTETPYVAFQCVCK